MHDLLSISQLAKLRGVTTETLRHYDRIGLFKPVYVDPNTNYRYYSILQYEQLGTIKELRQLNFSLEEIQAFFENRSVAHTLDMLEKCHKNLIDELKIMREKEKCVAEKIEYLRNLPQQCSQTDPHIVDMPERYYITTDEVAHSDEDMGYSYSKMESLLDEISPILATERMGLIPFCNDDMTEILNKWTTFIFVKKPNKTTKYAKYCKSFPAGKYVSMVCYDVWPEQSHAFNSLMTYIKEHNLTVAGNPLLFFNIDITITDSSEESTYIMQIPIKA